MDYQKIFSKKLGVPKLPKLPEILPVLDLKPPKLPKLPEILPVLDLKPPKLPKLPEILPVLDLKPPKLPKMLNVSEMLPVLDLKPPVFEPFLSSMIQAAELGRSEEDIEPEFIIRTPSSIPIRVEGVDYVLRVSRPIRILNENVDFER